MFLFYTVLQNVFVNIVLEGYEKARKNYKIEKNVDKIN
jgi:hypothetical protein